MQNKKRIVLATLAAALMAAAASVTAQAMPVISMPAAASGDARAPYGWVEFCRRMPAECAVNTAEPDRVTLTPKLLQLVESVNRGVNAEITPVTDQIHWGKAESWDLPADGLGDCEDYVLLKRQRLVAKGLPRRALRVTVVLDEVGDGHAILMLRTDRGDLILDNKHDEVIGWTETPYVYVKRESEFRLGWTSLGGQRGPTATASR